MVSEPGFPDTAIQVKEVMISNTPPRAGSESGTLKYASEETELIDEEKSNQYQKCDVSKALKWLEMKGKWAPCDEEEFDDQVTAMRDTLSTNTEDPTILKRVLFKVLNGRELGVELDRELLKLLNGSSNMKK
eukprot:Protomagalhaensia_wolfi_Nauph_80__75@NODE_1045_length_1774_cov_32_739481_g790_i0_p2_GENE_NODE_1045_length_1774_cov_32_739481_g790_i0NODE_1045_length_1774_cov_32_739481_g790_i0_p2_ORF_typecomplete_len132_score23_59_NODE_1045_length_1774_cov_32_739481_g790_i047442